MSNVIYHYTNFDAATSIIENKNIRLSSSLANRKRKFDLFLWGQR